MPDALEAGCYGWSTEPFSPRNHATHSVRLAVGEVAPDITLRSLDGVPISLYDLLATGPVMVQTGSYTCSRFRRNMPASELMAAAYPEVHFVIVYVPEAHPAGTPSPYHGVVSEARYSEFGQPVTYEERRTAAGLLEVENQLLLVDDLSPQGPDNPFWCTFATAANGASLIDQQGVVVAAHTWFDAATMAGSLDSLLGVSGRYEHQAQERRGRRGERRRGERRERGERRGRRGDRRGATDTLGSEAAEDD